MSAIPALTGEASPLPRFLLLSNMDRGLYTAGLPARAQKRKQGRSPVFPSIFRWPGAYARHTPGGLLPRRLYPPLASLSFPGSGSGTGYGLLTCLYSASSVPVKAAYSVRSACSNGSGSKIW